MIAIIYRIADGEILRTVDCPAGQVDLQCQAGEEFYLNCPPGATHIINNEPVTIAPPPPPPPPTEAEIISALSAAVQRHLDTTARTHNYDGILSLCSYAASTDPVFSAEGQAGVAWRDDCWRTCYQVMGAVKAGARAIPTVDELLALLPAMTWP